MNIHIEKITDSAGFVSILINAEWLVAESDLLDGNYSFEQSCQADG